MSKPQKNLIKNLITRIQNQEYLSTVESEDYVKFGHFTKANFHQVAHLMGNFTSHGTDTQPVKMNLLLEALNLPVLKKLVEQRGQGFEVLCNHYRMYVKLNKYGNQISINFSDLVASYVFYSIVEGDFLKNLESLAEADLSNQLIAKIPNAHFNHLLKGQLGELTPLDQNLFLVAVYGYMAFVISKCANKIVRPPVSKISMYYLAPVVTKSNQLTCTNSKELAKFNGYSLSCHTVSRAEFDSLSRLFTLTHGYDGTDADDWLYYSTGDRYGRYALSPSLGIKRKLNISEFYNL